MCLYGKTVYQYNVRKTNAGEEKEQFIIIRINCVWKNVLWIMQVLLIKKFHAVQVGILQTKVAHWDAGRQWHKIYNYMQQQVSSLNSLASSVIIKRSCICLLLVNITIFVWFEIQGKCDRSNYNVVRQCTQCIRSHRK